MTLLVSPGELAHLQAYAASTLDLPCVIKRKTASRDQYGSQSEVYGVVTTVMALMRPPTASQLQLYASALGSLVSWQVHFAMGTDVRIDDHLDIGGQTLEVQSFVGPESYAVFAIYLASEVREQ